MDLLSDRVNPIVIKEVRQALRGDAFFKLIWGVLLLSALASLVALTLAGRITEAEQVGLAFFGTVYSCLCLALMVVTPISAFQSLANEWDDDSFELLVASDLGPGQIIRGKLFSALVQGGLVAVAFLPMFAVALTLPGLDLIAAVMALLLLYLFCATSTALALGVASLSRRRPIRILLQGLLTAALLLAAFGLIRLGLILVVDVGPRLGSWPGISLFVVFAAAMLLGILALLIAQARICHPEENRSTPLRRWSLVTAVVVCGLYGAVHLRTGGPPGILLAVGHYVLLGLAPFLFAFTTESVRLPKRVAFEFRSKSAPRLPILMAPGGARGLVFAWVIVILVVVAISGFDTISASRGRLSGLFIGAGYLLAFLGLVSFVVRLLARGMSQTAARSCAFAIAVVLGIFPLLFMPLFSNRWMALLSPFTTYFDFGSEYVDFARLTGVATPAFYGAIALSLAVNLPAILTAWREPGRLRKNA